MRRSAIVIEDAASTAVDAAEVAIDVLDTLAEDVLDVASWGLSQNPLARRRWQPSWVVKGIAAALIVIGVIAVIHTILSRRKAEQEREQNLDGALADSFPASDPPTMTSPTG